MDVQPPPVPGANVVVGTAAAPNIFAGQAADPASSSPVPSGATGSAQHESGIAPAIAKIFGSSGLPQPVNLNVSYRVLKNDEIVTVFTDPQTGKEVAQFPPEILIGLAQFFDQQQGVTFDRNA